MGAQDGIICEVKKNLQRCGYTGSLLQADYPHQNGGSSRIPLVGFASSVRDSRTSCICVLACSDPEGVRGEYINSYRGLGAPAVFVHCGAALQWWIIGAGGAKHRETIQAKNLKAFFDKNRDALGPERIWRAKNLGRVDTRQQLSFVDVGLMPLLEHEMGERLGGLMARVIGFLREGFTADRVKQTENQQWVFRAAFWVLCARILKDKGVPRFIGLKLGDVDAVLRAVGTHYGAAQEIEAGTNRQRGALGRAGEEVDKFASLATLTPEAFGYMYENVLVDEKLRSARGIHATPSYLVDYIVWQLWPWIKEIPEDKRVVLEPACGHAPFLTGAMRLLRELFEGDEDAFHKYAKNNLIGMERDSFAREIARLSLTMADVPNPNGWRILGGDIYAGDTLSKQARNATILLCNPPFENFKPREQEAYKENKYKLKCFNKAAEMLWRTLPYMPRGSVFGVILPRAFLHTKKLTPLRGEILSDFELSQICELPEKVFAFAGHPSVLLLGRKAITGRTGRLGANGILYRKVSRSELAKFTERYEGRDQHVLQSIFSGQPGCNLRLRELDDVWRYCERNLPRLGSIADGGQGLIYKGEGLPQGAKTFEKERFVGGVKGYALFGDDVKLHELPQEYWMNLSEEVIRRPMWGTETGKPQIIMNYARVGSGAWRIEALIDDKGRPVTSRFLVFRIDDDNWSLHGLWAFLNSPLANAYVYCNSMERDNLAGTVRDVPLPSVEGTAIRAIEAPVREYFALVGKCDLEAGTDVQEEARRLLLSIDARVMRLYDLPPKMEKRVLDLFQGVQRKGVDFEFIGYYPDGFESAVPLHEYISEEYQRSTIQFADDWVRRHRSPDICRVLREATEAFEE